MDLAAERQSLSPDDLLRRDQQLVQIWKFFLMEPLYLNNYMINYVRDMVGSVDYVLLKQKVELAKQTVEELEARHKKVVDEFLDGTYISREKLYGALKV